MQYDLQGLVALFLKTTKEQGFSGKRVVSLCMFMPINQQFVLFNRGYINNDIAPITSFSLICETMHVCNSTWTHQEWSWESSAGLNRTVSSVATCILKLVFIKYTEWNSCVYCWKVLFISGVMVRGGPMGNGMKNWRGKSQNKLMGMQTKMPYQLLSPEGKSL